MATIWVIKKPEKFTLPNEYQRLDISSEENEQTGNYSFVKPLNSEKEKIKLFLAGEYFEIKEVKQCPDDKDLVDKTFVYPNIFYYTIYFLDNENVIYSMGNNIDGIRSILKRHFKIENPLVRPINLDLVEVGFRNGLVQISGHSFISEQGTIKTIKRKIDDLPFEPDDPHFDSGDDIDKEYLEVLMGFDDINKKFNVYPSGKITCRGRLESGTDGFNMLRIVYLKIKEVMKNSKQSTQS